MANFWLGHHKLNKAYTKLPINFDFLNIRKNENTKKFHVILTMSKKQRSKSKPQCGADLIFQWSTKFWIQSMLQEPDDKHCVDEDAKSCNPHFPAKRFHK